MNSLFYKQFQSTKNYPVKKDSLRISTIDMHTGGEPLRVITGGYPVIAQVNSLLDYRKILKQKYDYLRTALMFEPRGHADMYGCLLLPPFHSDADCSVIFMHNEGYSSMCGHATIALMVLSMEMGWVAVVNGKASLKIEAPCGLIVASGEEKNGKIIASFECVPSFVCELEQRVHVKSLNKNIDYDLAYGGAFYAYVNATDVGVVLSPENNRQLIELGKEIRQQVIETNHRIVHPFEADLSELYGVIFIEDSTLNGVDSRNVCIFADGELDRSPTGSGVSGRMAIHFKKQQIKVGQQMVIESILGSKFTVEVVREIEYGSHHAVIPKVTGNASVTGLNQWIVQPDDEFKHGFFLR